MKMMRDDYIRVQNLCKKEILDSVKSRTDRGQVVTEKFLDIIVDSMEKVTKHIGNIHKNKLREIAVGYILEVHGASAFGVDNGIKG